MVTREVIQGYFDNLQSKQGWDVYLADEMQFTSYTSPIKRVMGRDDYLEATKRFYSMIKTLEIRDMVVDGEKACVLTRYELQSPGGPAFESHVAEVFEVRGDKIRSFAIYFDSAAFPK